MTNGLPGDLYQFEELLTEDERLTLTRLREFLHAEVVPHANEWWARAEFPLSIIKGYAELGIAGLSYPEGPQPRPSSLLSGFLAMEMAHADPSMATFFGIHTGLAMGSIVACGSPQQRDRWLPPMSRMETIGAFATHRAHRRIGCCGRYAYDGPPRRGHVDSQRRQALDRQRHLRRRCRGMGPR